MIMSEELNMLHNNFVFVAIVVCIVLPLMLPLSSKGTMFKFWSSVSLNNVNVTTYTTATKPVDKILSENTSFLKKRLDLQVTKINEKLFYIYWTHKLHKILTRARVITAAPKSSVKPLSKAVTKLY